MTLGVIPVKEPEIDITWSNRKLERDCSNDRNGVRRFGAERWGVLKRRLASLAAAPTLEDMRQVPGNTHALTGDRAGQFAIGVTGSYRLVFHPSNDALSPLPDGGVDRRLVISIRIDEVVDYHGN